MPSVILRTLGTVVLLSTVACGYENPVQPIVPVVAPQPGVPARLELTANPGIGVEAGTGIINARVVDGLSTALPNVTVTFTAADGTLSASQVLTDSSGRASTRITGPTGPIAISASAGSVEQKTQIAIQAPPPTLPPPSVPIPVPPVTPTPGPTPGPVLPTFFVTLSSTPATHVQVGDVLGFQAVVVNPGGEETVKAYQWDLDGDGKFESTTVIDGRQSSPYTTPGFLTVQVMVTAQSGRTTTATLGIVVTN